MRGGILFVVAYWFRSRPLQAGLAMWAKTHDRQEVGRCCGAVQCDGRTQRYLQCWEGGELQLGIVVGPYNDAADYASAVVAKFRVDKEEPVEIIAAPSNLNGLLNLAASIDANPELPSLLRHILDAKQRVALSIGNAVFQADVRGTTKAIGRMFATCGIKSDDNELSTPPAPTAAH